MLKDYLILPFCIRYIFNEWHAHYLIFTDTNIWMYFDLLRYVTWYFYTVRFLEGQSQHKMHLGQTGRRNKLACRGIEIKKIHLNMKRCETNSSSAKVRLTTLPFTLSFAPSYIHCIHPVLSWHWHWTHR